MNQESVSSLLLGLVETTGYTEYPEISEVYCNGCDHSAVSQEQVDHLPSCIVWRAEQVADALDNQASNW